MYKKSLFLRSFSAAMIAALLLLTSPSYALQIKTAIDNEPISANIASQELSRIFIDGDRIASVTGVNGTYLLQNDEQQGAIFIKPTFSYLTQRKANAAQSQTLNIFVATESGHNFILELRPQNIPAETIMLKPKYAAKKALTDNTAPSYQQSLVRLITAMINHAVPNEYTVNYFEPAKKPQYTIEKAELYLTSVYKGEELRGEIYHLINKGKEELQINEQQFAFPHVHAVAIYDRTVSAQGETYLYLIVQ
jgi:conjugal transfer pilus assembly protein TraK